MIYMTHFLINATKPVVDLRHSFWDARTQTFLQGADRSTEADSFFALDHEFSEVQQ